LQQAQSYPLPTTQGLAGTVIKVTVNGTTETCIMVYTSATQAAAILPSATPVGTGTLTLAYQGGSGTSAIRVLAAGFGTLTLNEGGTGPAVVTDPSYNPITMINAAHAGDTLILWGTGLGPVTGDETQPPAQVDLGTGVQVLVGNHPATVTYGGRGSSPGLDQVNFVVPAGVTGCKTSVAVLVKGVTGNVTSTAIAPAGQTTCGDKNGVLTANNLQTAITNGALNVGAVAVTRFGSDNDELAAGFITYPLNSLIRSYGGSIGPSIGSCLSYEVSAANTPVVITDPIEKQLTRLDAGQQLILTGPNGPKAIGEASTGLYSGTLGTQSGIYIEPGNYEVENATGGANVPSFTWTLTLPSAVIPTNIPTSFSRAQDLTLTWSGGSAFPIVSIFLFAGVPVTSSQLSFAELVCNAAGSAGQFTIPAAVLNLLPANGYGATGVPGIGIQIAGVAVNNFVVAGSPGLDAAFFDAFTSSGGIAKVQ
jgi:uncharacterized protein (TIGR03437 family)